MDVADAAEGSRILDVATGTGEQALAFARRGYEVLGIDLSEDMLKVAKKKNNFGRVRFEVADATNLPFEDGSFDVTCISFALHDMPSSIREKALNEMARVIRSEGMVLIVDYGLPKSRVGKALVYHLMKLYEGPYYVRFIKSDLVALVSETGIEVREDIPVLLGAGRILKLGAGRILKGITIGNSVQPLGA